MKKIIIIFLILCFSLAITAVAPKSAYAADESAGTIAIVFIGTAVVVGGLLLLLSGGQEDEVQTMRNLYNPRLYKWTYDDMLSSKGQPTSVSEGTDTILAQYYDSKNITVGNTTYHSGTAFSPATSETESQNVTRYYGDKYSFYFDKKAKTLKGWMYSKMADNGQTALWNALGGNRNFTQDEAAKPIINGQRIISPPGPPASEKNTTTKPNSLENKLKELKDLKDKKLITDDEYKTAKQKLLDNAVK